jgi:hypothetical protein
MKALIWHGRGDVRLDTVPRPQMKHPRDAIVKVTLHLKMRIRLYDGYMPAMTAHGSEAAMGSRWRGHRHRSSSGLPQECTGGGTVSLSGVYGRFLNMVSLGATFQKGVTHSHGQCNVLSYIDANSLKNEAIRKRAH